MIEKFNDLHQFWTFILIFHNNSQIKTTCAGMLTVSKSGPISSRVNDYTDLVLICVLL